jgi:REP element-mobilizing transposase RayT
MSLEPLYHAETVKSAYRLRYSWTGWFRQPWRPCGGESILPALDPLWEQDGLRRLEERWSDKQIQITFSAKPCVSPVLMAGRVKGRLQYALRGFHDFPGFTRKVSVRSVGENTRQDVEGYIAGQVERGPFADDRFRDFLREFTVVDPKANLAAPSESARGEYWYNLHVVLVTTERYRVADAGRLTAVRDGSFRIAAKKGHRLAAVSVMPDHLHLALGGNINDSPEKIALGFQNNLAYLLGQVRLWRDSFYAGTFSEYDMGAIRRASAQL